jgi:hypothetical protein
LDTGYYSLLQSIGLMERVRHHIHLICQVSPDPVGCANDFNNLNQKSTFSELLLPEHFRIIRSRAVQ